MSTIDDYESRRGPVRRFRRGPTKLRAKRPEPRATQLALKLVGGTTAKDKGMPFDDPIPF
jgi:hypothetical protein